jgi:hypothetical protein
MQFQDQPDDPDKIRAKVDFLPSFKAKKIPRMTGGFQRDLGRG